MADRQGTSVDAYQDKEPVKITEEEITEAKKEPPLCEICVRKGPPVRKSWIGLESWFIKRVAVFLCSECEMYVCVNCLPGHESHEGMRVGRKESEREKETEKSECDGSEDQSSSERMKNKGKGLGKKTKRMRLEEEKEEKGQKKESDRTEEEKEREKSERMEEQGSSERRKSKGKGLREKTERIRLEEEREEEGEKSESDRMEEEKERGRRENEKMGVDSEGKLRWFLNDLMKESETERIESFDNSHVSIYDRVNVKHELDLNEHCFITGLCGLENQSWVACDCCNSCIKIFTLGSNVLQRYIRFVGCQPCDVTEILVYQNSTGPKFASGSSSGVSVTGRAEQDKQCLIAVTLPRQIMFIDLSKKPAFIHKVIRTEGRCYSIQFYDDKIFTVCKEDRPDFPSSVYIYSTDGDTLNKFDIGIYDYFPGPYLAVVSGRVYLTDRDNNKVQCRNVEGQVLSEITIERSGHLKGISVDPDNNVYVCAVAHNIVYKLDSDLTRYESLLDETSGYKVKPDGLCCYRDKIFLSHNFYSNLRNFVTVVRLL